MKITASLLSRLSFLQQAKAILFSLKDGHFAPVPLSVMMEVSDNWRACVRSGFSKPLTIY